MNKNRKQSVRKKENVVKGLIGIKRNQKKNIEKGGKKPTEKSYDTRS